MTSFCSRIHGTTAILAVTTGALAAPPAAAFADAKSTFVPCSAGAAGLITAINNANNGTGPRTITLAPGCAYFLTGATGLPPIAANITLKAKDAVIRRFSNTSFNIVRVSTNGRLTAQGITFAGGDAGSGQAGGIFVDSGGTLQLSDSRVTQNSAGSGGGGILVNPGGNARLFNTVVNNNSAGGQGAGILSNGNLTVVGGTIGFNTAGGSTSRGGGLSVNQGIASLISTDVVHNTAANGGGISNAGSGNVTLRNSRVQFNTANSITASGGGGGLINTSVLHVFASRLSDNRTTTSSVGGALNNGPGGTANIQDSTLTRDTAGNGGAIAEVGGSVTAVRSLITNNNPNNCVGTGPNPVPGCSG